MKILLMGNPNVGKSVIFSRLTGTNVTSSNYPGTTVEYTLGYLKRGEEVIQIIDVPGTYSLNPNNRAEDVAVKMLKSGSLVLNVLDATNLERNLNLTLQLLEGDLPVIVVLNMWDEAKNKGIDIDLNKLEERLGVPVRKAVATKGSGIREIIDLIDYDEVLSRSYGGDDERWLEIGRIVEEAQSIEHRHPAWYDRFEDLSIRPLTGVPIALLVLYLSFLVVRFLGEGLIDFIAEPFFEVLYEPLMEQLSVLLGGEGIFHQLLIGDLIDGEICFEESFGLLTTGIFIPFAAVLPYIISFYLFLGLMEDTGYLPRLAILMDNLMHRVGLHGFSIIPMILGLGCNVPAALAARTLESRREKFIASTLMAIAIPCMAQIAMIIGLLGPYGGHYIGYVFFILFLVWLLVGFALNKILSGFSSDLLLEIPPLRIPAPLTVAKKLWIRIISFLKEAIPFLLAGVFVVNLLYVFGIFSLLEGVVGPLLYHLFGLPSAAISSLFMGFLRKDLAMGMLVPLNLSVKELVVASTILTIYFPCMATFAVLVRELGFFDMLKATLVMLLTTVFVGGFVNLTFQNDGFSLLGYLIVILVFLAIWLFPKRASVEDPFCSKKDDIVC